MGTFPAPVVVEWCRWEATAHRHRPTDVARLACFAIYPKGTRQIACQRGAAARSM